MSSPPSYNPYAPPQFVPSAPAGSQPWADPRPGRIEGAALVLPNGGALPAVCLKCGTYANLQTRSVTFRFLPVWARFILYMSPLIGVFVMLFARKSSRFQLPLCVPCNAVWSKWTLLAWLTLPVVVVLLIIGEVSALATDGRTGGGILAVAALGLSALAVTVLVVRRRRIVVATKIDKTHTWITGVHPEAKRAAAPAF